MRHRVLVVCLVLLNVAGLAALVCVPGARVFAQEERTEYKSKAETLTRSQAEARIELARWCIARGLLAEAREQLRVAARIDPSSKLLLPAWQELVARIEPKKHALRVALDDGNVIHGECAPRPMLLQNEKGVELIRLEDVKSIQKTGDKDGLSVIAIETAEGTFEGTLHAEPLVITSSLGVFKVPLDRVRRFTFGEGAGAEVGDMKGGVEINWNKHLVSLQKDGLDVVIVFDSTGSMGGVIAQVKTRIRQLLAVMDDLVPNTRVGLVTFRDLKKYDLDDFEYSVKYMPLKDIKGDEAGKLEAFLRSVEAYGGGDIPEAVYEGVQTAIARADWRKGSRKIIILFGDAPPRPEKDGLRKVYALVEKWHKDTDGVVQCIDTTGSSRVLAEFKQIAKSGGGEAVFLNDERAIIKQLLLSTFGRQWEKELAKALKKVESRK